MAKRCIGIDFGSSYFCAVQLSQSDRSFSVEKVFSVPVYSDTDSPQSLLRTLTGKHGFDRRADIAVSLPQDAVFFRNLETDSVSDEQITQLSAADLKLEHNFPIQPDQTVAQICSYRQLPGEKVSLLVAAVKRESLHQTLNTLTQAKLHPVRVEASIFAVHAAVMTNHPESMTGRVIIAYINESRLTLAIIQNNDILLVRNIPTVAFSSENTPTAQERIAEVLSSEAEITWRKVFGEQIEKNTKIYLATGTNASDDLKLSLKQNLQYQVIIVDPYAEVKCSAQSNTNAEISVAEGLALRQLAPEKTSGVNFIEADNANIKPDLNLKKELTICAILVAAIIAVSLAGLFIRLSNLEKKHTRIKNEIKNVFQQILPDEKNIVNPLAQFEQKLQSLRRNYKLFSPISAAGLGPLEVLYAITESVPVKVGININSMMINAESVRLTGISRSFESVYNWQKLLEKTQGFSNIDVQNLKRKPESQMVQFTMVMSLETVENK